MSAAALKTGAALDVVIKAAGGSAQRDLDKFGTQVIKLQQAFGDIFEDLGTAIVKNPAVIEGLKIITALFKEIGTAVGENNEICKTFVSGSLSQMVKGLYVVSQVIEAINNAFFKLAKFLEPAVQALESFDKATEALKKGDIRGFTRSLDIVGNSTIRKLISEDKVAQMYLAIQTGQQSGMMSLDQHLQDLVKRSLITRQQAMEYAKEKRLFE